MDDDIRRRVEMMLRVQQFGVDNPPAVGSTAATQYAELDTAISDLNGAAGEQLGGFGEAGLAFEVKGTMREDLRDKCYAISRTARALEYTIDGVGNMFRMPSNLSDQSLIATANAFHDNSATYNLDFIGLGMDLTFRAELQSAIDAFEASFGAAGTAIDHHVAATAEMRSIVRQGMINVRTLDAIHKNQFAGDVGTLAAWLSASHVESPPKITPPVTP